MQMARMYICIDREFIYMAEQRLILNSNVRARGNAITNSNRHSRGGID